MDLLRFITAGSVDDGKSTLIGRLLYDTKSVLTDQMDAIERASKTRNQAQQTNAPIDLALLTDGLRSEREQGITIDVAYKYFQTPTRKYISIDAPGHIQYTRNMVTGASNADLAVVLIDARHGVIEQTKRHSLIASMLGIEHVLVAVNKMDLVNYSESVFINIASTYKLLAESLKINNLTIIPVSALNGDNVATKTTQMTWYAGESVLEHLENVQIRQGVNVADARFPVQYVIRPQTAALPDYRGYAGKLLSGVLKKGDEVTVLPSGRNTQIESIEFGEKEIGVAIAPQSVVLHLKDNLDISRGDMVVPTNNQPILSQDIETIVCWMDDRKALRVGNKYTLQHGVARVRCVVKAIEYKIDVNTYEKNSAPNELLLNDVARITLRSATALPYDSYARNRANGTMILIDETSNITVGACMIEEQK